MTSKNARAHIVRPFSVYFLKAYCTESEILRCCFYSHVILVLVLMMDISAVFKATPHRACAEDAQTDFLSDCIEIPQAYLRMSRNYCAR